LPFGRCNFLAVLGGTYRYNYSYEGGRGIRVLMKYGPMHSTVSAIIAMLLNSVIYIYFLKVVSAKEVGERPAAARTSEINTTQRQ
jgi:hypothetical protein